MRLANSFFTSFVRLSFPHYFVDFTLGAALAMMPFWSLFAWARRSEREIKKKVLGRSGWAQETSLFYLRVYFVRKNEQFGMLAEGSGSGRALRSWSLAY